MTSTIGIKTHNLSVNIPIDEDALYNRLWVRLGFRSKGAFNRAALAKGVEVMDQEAAAELRQIRRQYYGVACSVLCLTTFIAALIAGEQDMRRAGRRVREERIEEARVEA